MKKIVRLISAVICFFQLNVQAEEPKEYTFAINSAVTPLLHAAFINETIKTVERSVAPAKLKVLYVELPELERLIENHQTDFFISTAATIRRYQDLGARDVLTASSPFSKNRKISPWLGYNSPTTGHSSLSKGLRAASGES